MFRGVSASAVSAFDPDGDVVSSQILPPPTEFPEFPPAWLENLYREPRQRGARPEPGSPVDIEDITAAARQWVFDECPARWRKPSPTCAPSFTKGRPNGAGSAVTS